MDALSRYLVERESQAQLQDNSEVQRIQSAIENVLKTILTSVAAKDSRLTGNLIPVGSYYSELKIGNPDEFDYIYELSSLEEGQDFEVMPSGFRGTNNLWRTPKGDPGKKKIFLRDLSKFATNCEDLDSSSQWDYKVSSLNSGEYVLQPIGVKNTLYYKVLEAVEELEPTKFHRYLDLDESSEQATFVHGPAVTLYFKWNGRRYKNLKISVDVTVALKATKWEPHFDFLETHDMCVSYLSRNIITEEITHNGYHLVPHVSERGHVQWKISTSYLENRIFSRFSRNSSIKRLIRLLKSFKDEHLRLDPNIDLYREDGIVPANVVRFWREYGFTGGHDEHNHLVSSYLISTSVLSLCCFTTYSTWTNASFAELFFVTMTNLYLHFFSGEMRRNFISQQKLKVPSFLDILPGFRQVFHTTNDILIAGKQELLNEDVLKRIDWVKVDSAPFDYAVECFQRTKLHIDECFAANYQS